MIELRFSKQALERLPPAKPGARDAYSDSEARGLSLRVTENGVKTFLVYRKIAGKPLRVTLGRFPQMTVEQARRRAALEMAKLVEGRDPNAEKKGEKLRAKSLSQVLEDYIAARKSLKPSTGDDYRKRLRELFQDWADKPIAELNRDMVAQRHNSIGARSPSQANKGMRILRALFNFAAGAYEDADGHPIVVDNPVKRISHTRSWYRVDRRRTIIEPEQLPAWWKAVMALRSRSSNESAETVRDYLIFLLLTGLRREEAAGLRWEHVDLAGKKFMVLDTKNREPHALPLTDHLLDLLRQRKTLTGQSPFVFASHESARGYIHNPYKQMKRVTTESGVTFTLHDLRRTFTTAAERLDISHYTIKRLINHRMPGDVTAGYIVIQVERLRKPLQAINDYLLETAHELPPALQPNPPA